MHSIIFDGSFEGFLCVVYAYYYDKIIPSHIQREDEYQETLDAEVLPIFTDQARAARVLDGINKKISPDAAEMVFFACLSGEDDIYMDIFKYTVLGFKVGSIVDSYLQTDYVRRVHTLHKRVGHETHMLTGFCRFQETRQGVYYCAVTPKNHVLPLLAEHFTDRFKNQAWVIHDKKHGQAAVYDGSEYVIGNVGADAKVEFTENETRVQDLWKLFFKTIAIQERASYKRQRQMLKLYFRNNMVEFK
jgi:probable DNA metabolism protein